MGGRESVMPGRLLLGGAVVLVWAASSFALDGALPWLWHVVTLGGAAHVLISGGRIRRSIAAITHGVVLSRTSALSFPFRSVLSVRLCVDASIVVLPFT